MINDGDSRLFQGVNAEEILRRSRRGDIVPYLLRMTGVRQAKEAWREAIHARLWDSLTPQQQDSWEGILNGFNSITYVMQAKAFDLSGAKGKSVASDDHQAVLQADYAAWANLVRHRRLKFDMIINMLAGGMSVREAARSARPKTSDHFARLGLIAALDIYSELRGWR